MPGQSKTHEAQLKSGGKVFFLVVTGAGRAKIRSGKLLAADREIKALAGVVDPEQIHEASNRIEKLHAGIMAEHVCDAAGNLLYKSADDYLDQVDVDSNREMWSAFMAYVFGDGKSGN